jgi:hypothetical protein
MAAYPWCCSQRFSFILADGTEVFPVQLQSQNGTQPRYRVSLGRRGGHALRTGEDVDEATMFQKVVNQGYAIRCTSANGAVCGLYRRCPNVLCKVSPA